MCWNRKFTKRIKRLKNYHIVFLNTYVYAEWTTLIGLYDGRARYIIPHKDPRPYKDSDGLLSDGDALTEEFNTIITDIIEKERKKQETN